MKLRHLAKSSHSLENFIWFYGFACLDPGFGIWRWIQLGLLQCQGLVWEDEFRVYKKNLEEGEGTAEKVPL